MITILEKIKNAWKMDVRFIDRIEKLHSIDQLNIEELLVMIITMITSI